MSLTDDAIQSIRGKHFKSRNDGSPGTRIAEGNHYLKVRGSVIQFGENIRTLVRVDLIYKLQVLDCWSSVSQGISFDKLGFYEEVPKEELPWNKGEKWYSQTPWARISDRDLAKMLTG